MPDEFIRDDIIIRAPVVIEWNELGEGWSGDYNEEDETDEELLRFDVGVIAESELAKKLDTHWDVDWNGFIPDGTNLLGTEVLYLTNGSFCTRFPASVRGELRKKALTCLMDKLYTPVMEQDWKRAAEEASWIEPGWVENT